MLSSCASGPNGASSTSAKPLTPSDSASVAPGTTRLLQFALTINDQGSFDSVNGFYVIMLNAFGTPIDVTNNDKFTDFMQWDGTYLLWYHRQTSPSSNLYTFIATNTMNQNVSFSEDRHTLVVTLNPSEQTSPLAQYISSNAFTVCCATTDRQGILGRVIDTLGPGPSLNNDALYTYFIDKTLGLTYPAPPEYPNDRLNDWITQPDNDANFPYVNFDIKKFEVTLH